MNDTEQKYYSIHMLVLTDLLCSLNKNSDLNIISAAAD